MSIVIDNDYGFAKIDYDRMPPNSPLDFGGLAKLAINLTPQSSAPSNPNSGWVYLDDGTNTESGHKGLRYYNGASWDDLLGYTTGEIEDLVNSLLIAGDKLNTTYDDGAGTLTIDTTALDEAEIDTLITEGNAIGTTYDSGAGTLTIAVDESEISHDNISDVSEDDHHVAHEQPGDKPATSDITDDKGNTIYDYVSEIIPNAILDYFSGSHEDLSDVSADDHHAKTTS